MNDQEKMNAARQFLTMFFSMLTVAVPALANSQQYSAVTTGILTALPALATLYSIAWSIYAHWNMKKVPENATAMILPTPPPAAGTTINLAPLTGLAKVVGVLLFAFLVALSFAMPTHAAQKGFQFPKVKPITLPQIASPVPIPSPQKLVDPLTFLRQFSYTDVNNALEKANAASPPNKTSAQCWAYLLTLLPAPAVPATATTPAIPATPGALPTPASLLPAVPGIASAIEAALDDEQILLTWLSPNGGLAQLNMACAPLVNMLNAKLLVGGTLTAAGAAAVANPATAPIIAGVQTLLTGAIALVPK